MAILTEKAKAIKLVIFDVDGVLTNRQIFYSNTGEELKAFNTHDGLGLKLLQKSGVKVAVITARTSRIVEKRMTELGIEHFYQGQENKNLAFTQIAQQLQLNDKQIAYVGDDLPDLSIMRRCGLGIAVADAHPFVRAHADWQTQAVGGHGAAREVCDFIMKAQQTFNSIYESYL